MSDNNNYITIKTTAVVIDILMIFGLVWGIRNDNSILGLLAAVILFLIASANAYSARCFAALMKYLREHHPLEDDEDGIL